MPGRSQVESDVRSFDAADARKVTQEVVDELLGSTDPLYGDGGATTVRPYDPALLAWPAMDGKGLPLARDAPDDVMSYVEGNALGWVRTRSSVRKDTRHTSMPQLYRDEIFKNDRKHYVSFINEGARRGLFSFTKDKMESVAPFFVVKKDGRLRIIFDCRRSNRWFIRAPHVPLFSGAGFATVEVDDEQVYAGGDVKAAFYCHEIPEWLRLFFVCSRLASTS